MLELFSLKNAWLDHMYEGTPARDLAPDDTRSTLERQWSKRASADSPTEVPLPAGKILLISTITLCVCLAPYVLLGPRRGSALAAASACMSVAVARMLV